LPHEVLHVKFGLRLAFKATEKFPCYLSKGTKLVPVPCLYMCDKAEQHL
jgi:hypothetical protein